MIFVWQLVVIRQHAVSEINDFLISLRQYAVVWQQAVTRWQVVVQQNAVAWQQTVIQQQVVVQQYAVVEINDFFLKTQNSLILTTACCCITAGCNTTASWRMTAGCCTTTGCHKTEGWFILTYRYMYKYNLEFRLEITQILIQLSQNVNPVIYFAAWTKVEHTEFLWILIWILIHTRSRKWEALREKITSFSAFFLSVYPRI